MKNNMTIRRKVFPVFFLAACIPIILIAMISQNRLNDSLNENIDQQIENNLTRADQSLDMVMDKYDTLLYDLCTNDEIIEVIDEVNRQKDTLGVNTSVIHQELNHLCNRDEGIAAITIITAENKVLFYDELTGSYVNTSWADSISLPEQIQGLVCRGNREPVEIGGDKTYMFQMVRRFVDYRDIHKSIGTAIFSLNVEELHAVLESGDNADIILTEHGRTIAALDKGRIGKLPNVEDTEHYRYTQRTNEKSGFTIMNRHSLKMYHQMMRERAAFWVLVTAFTVGILVLLSYFLTRPYLRKIDQLAEAMSKVEQGDFQVKMLEKEADTIEIQKISSGFNHMVQQIDVLIGEVTKAVVEQKNAELSALEAQIDPHFLYNTLDTINWKAIEAEQYELSEMVGALADILRYTVKNAGAEASVAQELHWLEQYILLQKAKLGRELEVEMHVPEELQGCRIHKLLLQPFVENAMKHGFREQTGELKLTLTMKQTGNQIHITIEDNGVGMDEAHLQYLNEVQEESQPGYSGEHLGIVNVRRRLALYYEGEAGLYFESKAGQYTRVHLFIPARYLTPAVRQKETPDEGEREEVKL